MKKIVALFINDHPAQTWAPSQVETAKKVAHSALMQGYAAKLRYVYGEEADRVEDQEDRYREWGVC